MSIRILVDVDGVLADFVGALCRDLATYGHCEYSAECFTSWDLSSALPLAAHAAKDEIMQEPGFCHSMEWYPGAQDFLVGLQQIGEVFAVTAPYDKSETWIRERQEWIKPFIDRKHVLPIAGESKRVVRGDYLIEDHPGNAKAWLEENPDGVALLIARPWNTMIAKEYVEHTRMVRVNSYAIALEIIRRTKAAVAAAQVAA